jgi:hypothetical protein
MTAPASLRIMTQVHHGLTGRLLAHQVIAQIAHVIAIAVLVIVLWGTGPHRLLLVWAVGVVGATLARAGVTHWSGPDFPRLCRNLRVALALTGLAWGLGAAALVPYMREVDGVLVLAVLTTLVTGAGATLVADPVALAIYSVCALVPLGGEMIAIAPDRLYLFAGALVAPFIGFTILTSREAHRDLTARLRTAAELEETLGNVRTLSGLLPICASCKKIRDDRGYWNQIEEYVGEHTHAEFSHGLCPECAQATWGAVS